MEKEGGYHKAIKVYKSGEASRMTIRHIKEKVWHVTNKTISLMETFADRVNSLS